MFIFIIIIIIIIIIDIISIKNLKCAIKKLGPFIKSYLLFYEFCIQYLFIS